MTFFFRFRRKDLLYPGTGSGVDGSFSMGRVESGSACTGDAGMGDTRAAVPGSGDDTIRGAGPSGGGVAADSEFGDEEVVVGIGRLEIWS